MPNHKGNTPAQKRAERAAGKVRELVKKGYRLREGAGSKVYKEATAQKKMGSYKQGLGAGTGRSAEKVARRIKRGG